MGSLNLRPIKRLTANTVFWGLVMACRRAIWPSRRSPLSEKATTEGVVRLPSALVSTLGSPPSMMATQELVVPKINAYDLCHLFVSLSFDCDCSVNLIIGPVVFNRRFIFFF